MEFDTSDKEVIFNDCKISKVNHEQEQYWTVEGTLNPITSNLERRDSSEVETLDIDLDELTNDQGLRSNKRNTAEKAPARWVFETDSVVAKSTREREISLR